VFALDVIGQSAWSADRRVDLRDDSYGRWLVESCDALGLGQFDLFGVSWGGFVALRAARFAPNRLKHLVLMVPAGLVANGFWAGFRDSGWPLILYRLLGSRKRLERFASSIFTDMDSDWVDYFEDALRCYRFDMRIPPLAGPGDLDALHCPTLVFGAEHDSQFPGLALTARAKELIPQAEVELLEGSKHSPSFSDAFRARTAARVERFLASGDATEMAAE